MIDRRAGVVLTVAAVIGIAGGAGTALTVGADDGADDKTAGTTLAQPLWTTSTELHDGDTVVPLEGVGFVTGLERIDDHWVLQDMPDGTHAKPRVLRVDPDGSVAVLAETNGYGDIDAHGTHHVGLGPDGESYVVTDLTSGDTTRVAPPPDPGSPEGTALFDGDAVITGWSPVGTTYYRSNLDGTDLTMVGRDIGDGRFAPDRSRYVGLRVGLSQDCVLGGPAQEEPDLWRSCPGGLGAASPYSPDGTRVVTLASTRPEGMPKQVNVLDAATGKRVAQVDLPDDVFDVAMLDDERLEVVTVTGPDGAQQTTVHVCDLSSRCTEAGTAKGVGVLGTSR
ncbi:MULTISPECIES: hypothetical protein [unclassified Nocardioides]|uniref:hypothetical protein n=1 Tax=unclassified Nocardioides TaxID=2615069 RepID=UPI000702FDDA|nr:MULTISPECIES: hypothetical protein [unclassified Nocardioides]KRC53152.1 hypothetical protein ASE19_12290 [Nocardioides sp. Root79]KRC72680.1 hypothetical protein ASE20_08815 [Nocardioides sp. Root240]